MKVKDLINILSKFDPEANIMHELTGFEELPGSYDGTATRIVLPKKCKYNCLAELYDALYNGEITREEYDKILSKSYFEFSPVPNQVVFETYTLSDWIENIDHKGNRVRSETFSSYEWWCPSTLKEILKNCLNKLIGNFIKYDEETIDNFIDVYPFVKVHKKEIKKRIKNKEKSND